MKTLFLLTALCFSFLFASAQTDTAKVSTSKTTIVATDAGTTITLPALPAKGASPITWLWWIISAALGVDAITRLIPTTGKYAWLTKLIGLIHDLLLYLDNTKKTPDSKTNV